MNGVSGKPNEQYQYSPQSPMGQPPPASYYAPPPMYHQPQLPNHPSAVASLVLGIVSCCSIVLLGMIGCIIAFICGIIGLLLGRKALNEIKADPYRFKGEGMARAGMITSGIALGIGGLFFLGAFALLFIYILLVLFL